MTYQWLHTRGIPSSSLWKRRGNCCSKFVSQGLVTSFLDHSVTSGYPTSSSKPNCPIFFNRSWTAFSIFGRFDKLSSSIRRSAPNENILATTVASAVQHLESRGTIHSYFEIGLKPAVFGCLPNAIAPPPIALDSCSNPQKIRQVF